MNMYELTPATIPAVAHLMCTIKPDWWDYDGAYGHLTLSVVGFDDNGAFKQEHKLGELFDVAEKYTRKKGYMTFRSGISSLGFNIHGKEI